MAEMNVPGVEYRDIAGFPGYRLGSDGTLWSRKRNAGAWGDWRQLTCHPWGNRKQYRMAILSRDGKMYRRTLHILMLEVFVGPRPNGMDGCHEDDNQANNRLGNLRWDTKQANYEDRERNGKTAAGERNGHAKLSAEDVVQIRELSAGGATNLELAAQFKCNTRNISQIVLGQTWKSVGGVIRSGRRGNCINHLSSRPKEHRSGLKPLPRP